MTLAEMQTVLRWSLGGTLASQHSSGDGLTVLNYWINYAYRRLCNIIDLPALERLDTSMTTASGVASVTLPTDTYAVLTFYDVTNSHYIHPLNGGWEEYERQGVIIGSTSTNLTHWTRFGNSAYFKPRPAGAYALRAKLKIEPPLLSAAGSTPIIPPIWHDGIVILAKAKGWRDNGDDSRANAILAGEWREFMSGIRTPRAVEGYTRRGRGIRVKHNISDRTLGI